MGHLSNKLRVAATLLVAAGAVNGQSNQSTVGSGPSAAEPTWDPVEYTQYGGSPAVYPTREWPRSPTRDLV